MCNYLVLKKNWQFQKIINNKKQIFSNNIIVYYDNAETFTLGISIPKKIVPNAVKRNYYKRQIKNILNEYTGFDKIKKQIVLIMRQGYFHLSFEEKKKLIFKYLERLQNNG